ncbi:MAG TPA: type II and III secretion system protein family protein [Parvularculaceae bacterium]|nr:type II and III secretion system protein family protein [Parvularculaceae bacterium]
MKPLFNAAALRSPLAGFAFLAASAAFLGPAAEAAPRPPSVDVGGTSAVSRHIVLPLNKAAIVELPVAASDVLVSQPSVVDAVVKSPHRVYLLGQKVGQTNAFFFDADNHQILDLEIVVEQDVRALTDLFARLMPDSRITAEAVNDNIILKGIAKSSVDAANAADIAGRFVGDATKVLTMVTIRQPEQVMLKVRIVEMQRQLIKQLGITTSGTVQLSKAAFTLASKNAIGAAGGFLGTGKKTNTGDLENLDAQVEALESNGLVRILAEPNLTAVSGESAKFLAGGEFPVPVGQSNNGITIEFKEFGVGLGFTPVVLDKGRISLKISTEVSQVTSENSFVVPGAFTVDPNTGQLVTTGNLAIPGLSVRRANTTVEMPSGGSLVMAGLLQEDMRQTIQGIPGLKDTPILGQLFRSRDYNNGQTELVIMVTPYLVDSTQEDKLTDPAAGSVPASDLQTILLGKLLATYGLSGTGVREKTLQGPLGFILD